MQILDLHAFVFFFQIPVFQLRKLPEDACKKRNVVIKNQTNCYFHNLLSRLWRINLLSEISNKPCFQKKSFFYVCKT